MPTYVDPSVNYEQTAQAWAHHLDKPFDTHGPAFELSMQLLEAIFIHVYPETIEYIEVDPTAFAARVASYRYALHSRE